MRNNNLDMFTSNLGVAPGAMAYPGGVAVGAPLAGGVGVVPGVGMGGSVLPGTPMGTTNQFYTQGYNQGLFGCNNCPWWLWLIIGFLLIASLIGILACFFGGSERRERRRRRRAAKRATEDEEAGNTHYFSHLRTYY